MYLIIGDLAKMTTCHVFSHHAIACLTPEESSLLGRPVFTEKEYRILVSFHGHRKIIILVSVLPQASSSQFKDNTILESQSNIN